jgi:AraC-like DNA-binding protein
VYKGGLGAARLRRIKELVHAKMEDGLSLDEMAQSVGLSTAHFARMFRKSTSETPHQFVLRQKVERAKAMLRVPDARVFDVAMTCGFKTSQHFAQVFRDFCRVSPTEYRQDFLGSEANLASEIRAEDTSLSLVAFQFHANVQPFPEFVTHRCLHRLSTVVSINNADWPSAANSNSQLSSSFTQDSSQSELWLANCCLAHDSSGFQLNVTMLHCSENLPRINSPGTGWVIGGSDGAAARLGLKRTTLVAKMKKLGISRAVRRSDITRLQGTPGESAMAARNI